MKDESLFGLSLITLIFEDRVDAFASRLLVSQRLTGADLMKLFPSPRIPGGTAQKMRPGPSGSMGTTRSGCVQTP